MAIDAARAGSPRRTEIAEIRAAFSACSTLSSTVRPSTTAVQPSAPSRNGTRTLLSTPYPTAATTPTPASATSAGATPFLMSASVAGAWLRGSCEVSCCAAPR